MDFLDLVAEFQKKTGHSITRYGRKDVSLRMTGDGF